MNFTIRSKLENACATAKVDCSSTPNVSDPFSSTLCARATTTLPPNVWGASELRDVVSLRLELGTCCRGAYDLWRGACDVSRGSGAPYGSFGALGRHSAPLRRFAPPLRSVPTQRSKSASRSTSATRNVSSSTPNVSSSTPNVPSSKLRLPSRGALLMLPPIKFLSKFCCQDGLQGRGTSFYRKSY